MATASMSKRSLGRDAVALIASIWVLQGIAIIVVGIRLATSLKVYRRIFYADILMILALIFSLLSTSFETDDIRSGLLNLSTAGLAATEKIFSHAVLGTVFGTFATWLGRVSFAVWILSLAHLRSIKIILWACITVTTINDMGYIVLLYTTCHSKLGGLSGLLADAECRSHQNGAVAIWQGTANTCLNLALALLPAFLVSKLFIPIRLKVRCWSLLAVSVLAAVASLVRMIEARLLLKQSNGGITLEGDAMRRFVFWSLFEMDVIIIVASIPTIRPMFLSINRRRRATDSQPEMSESPNQDYLTTWTGFVGSPLYAGPTEHNLGTTITIQAGIRKSVENRRRETKSSRKGQDTLDDDSVKLVTMSTTASVE